MNTTTKFSLFIFAFLLVGAGCLGGDKQEVVEDSRDQGIEEVQSDDVREVEEVTADAEGIEEVEDDTKFKMVADPQPATAFDKDEFLTGSITASQVLKMDVDADGVLEYVLVYTQDDILGPSGNKDLTIEYLKAYKWNGASWVQIFEDGINRKSGDEPGWFNQYEVIRINGGNHVLYVEKAGGKGQIEEYHFGQLKDGSFGKIK